MKRSLVKTKLLFILFLGITFLGCSDNLDNSPVATPITAEKLTYSHQSENEPKTPTGIESLLHASQLINGKVGGWLILDENYINTAGREIDVYARVRVLPGAYEGTVNIEMFLNDEDVSLQLFPEMTFNREVRLDVWFRGADLEALGYTESRDVDFAYFADNGDVELIENKKSKVDTRKNKIVVRNAKLNHFSRYGWTR